MAFQPNESRRTADGEKHSFVQDKNHREDYQKFNQPSEQQKGVPESAPIQVCHSMDPEEKSKETFAATLSDNLSSNIDDQDGFYMTELPQRDGQHSDFAPGSRSKSVDEEKMQFNEQGLQKQTAMKEKENITAESLLLNYINRGDAIVPVCPCSTTVFGTEKCGKTRALLHMLNHTVKTKDEKVFSDLLKNANKGSREYLSFYEMIILGAFPYDSLTWLMSTNEIDWSVTCLLSYFTDLCKRRNYENYSLLDFMPHPATSAKIDPEVFHYIKMLHTRLQSEWNRLQEDKEFQAAIIAGVCLLNVFDFGPSTGAQVFLPFFNKYCRRSLNLACYNTKDGQELLREFTKESGQSHCQSRKHQLMKQLSGSFNKKQVVAVTAINMGSDQDSSHGGSEYGIELGEAVRKCTGIEHIHSLQVSKEVMVDIKVMLEKSVTDASFYSDMHLNELVLFFVIRNKCKSFWMGRGEVEKLSEHFGFENGSLDRFLRLFSSFGSIFYTHDVQLLKEYVIIDITQFFEYIHKLYTSNEELAKFGLFKNRDEEDWKVLFLFLTAFEIATEVKSNKIFPCAEMMVDVPTSYYYIPTARKSSLPMSFLTHQTDVPQETYTFTYGCIKEDVQTVITKHMLLIEGCLLTPKEGINVTMLHFLDMDSKVELVDFGNELQIALINPGDKKDRVQNALFSARNSLAMKSNSKINYDISVLVDGRKQSLQNVEQRLVLQTTHSVDSNQSTRKCCEYFEPLQLVLIAERLTNKYKEDLTQLISSFRITREFLEQYKHFHTHMIILCMLFEFTKNVTVEEFIETLESFGVSVKLEEL